MLLKQALDDKLMDYRVRERLLQEGKITKEELEKFFSEMEDEEGNYESKEVK